MGEIITGRRGGGEGRERRSDEGERMEKTKKGLVCGETSPEWVGG
jgi:hypothetical protein